MERLKELTVADINDTNASITNNNAPSKKKMSPCKIIKRSLLLKVLLPLIFKLHSIAPLNGKLVVFADFRYDSIPNNMKPLYDALEKKGYILKTFLKPEPAKIFRKYTKLFLYMRFSRCFAKAKYTVVCDYFPPLYAVTPRKGQKIIQLWHGAGAFKKFGYSTLDKSWGMNPDEVERFPVHNNYTHVVVSSKEIIPHYAEAFNISPDIIFDYGFPRSDVFFDEVFKKRSREKFLKIFPKAEGKKVILYAPTFRGVTTKRAFTENKIDISCFKEKLAGEYVLVNKFHPLARLLTEDGSDGEFSMDVTSLMDINEALCCADIVISDYSSLIFEYALLERPMIFYAYDLDDYIDGRDFYYDYKDFVPGPIVKENEEIVETILDMEKHFDIEKVRRFKEKFMSACDGHSTQRIMEQIFEKD